MQSPSLMHMSWRRDKGYEVSPCDLGIVLRVQGMGALTCLRPYVLTHLHCLRLTLHGCLRAVVIDDCR